MPPTLLLVEDDPAAAALIEEALRPGGHLLVHARSVAEGWTRFQALKPAVVILDVGLPDGSGTELCRRIRKHPALGTTPVIMLTGKGKLDDKTEGFAAGSDHYLVKPVQIEELLLWVGALLRRVELADKDSGILRVEDFAADPGTHTVSTGGRLIRSLTRKEFELLCELMRVRPRVLSKERIMKELWDTVLRDNTIEVHIRNLRKKLGTAAWRIVTVPGVGYRFEEDILKQT